MHNVCARPAASMPSTWHGIGLLVSPDAEQSATTPLERLLELGVWSVTLYHDAPSGQRQQW
jgi:hypothetical protein